MAGPWAQPDEPGGAGGPAREAQLLGPSWEVYGLSLEGPSFTTYLANILGLTTSLDTADKRFYFEEKKGNSFLASKSSFRYKILIKKNEFMLVYAIF